MLRIFPLVSVVALLATAQDRIATNLYSPAQEVALGAQLAAQVRSQSTVIGDSTISRYVSRVGDKLAAVVPAARGTTYAFYVVDRALGGSTNEPLALPGGAIFIPANLLLAARSEDELAGMLAHSIAHVEARHGTRQATRAQVINLPTAPILFVSSPAANDQSPLPRDLQSLEQSFETEADQIAVAMLAQAGYDPHALADYVARLQNDAATAQSSALPNRDERVTAIRSAIRRLPRNEFSVMQDQLRRLLPAPDQGALVR